VARLIVYFAHPGQRHSRANAAMVATAKAVDGITFVDLYAEYPRFDIDIDREQGRLLDHDVILLQFPLFWYSTPAILKEWQDLVLEHGFAYGSGGDRLTGKTLMLAVTAAGPRDAYRPGGYQGRDLRSFLAPLEQTAALCGMRFATPFVLFGSLKAAEDGRIRDHARAYGSLLAAIRDDRHDFAAGGAQVLTFDHPTLSEGV